ncbi:MAG TPA: hypothetical protein PKH89_07450 [Anaerolineae bacterium]|nr:hypothetical protein [Anaerolineae bacterium]
MGHEVVQELELVDHTLDDLLTVMTHSGETSGAILEQHVGHSTVRSSGSAYRRPDLQVGVSLSLTRPRCVAVRGVRQWQAPER